jgi:aconitase A
MVCELTQAVYPGSGNAKPYFQQRGNDAYITRTGVSVVGITSTAGEGKSPSP